MMILRGAGAIVLGTVFCCSASVQLLTMAFTGGGQYWDEHAWPLAAALMCAGIIIWRVGIARERGEPAAPDPKDAVVIRMRHWGLVALCIGAYVLIADKAPGAYRADAAAPVATGTR